LYVDAENTNDISDKIFELIKNQNLRKDLEKKSIMESNKFSWEKCAKETFEVYKICQKQ